MTMAGKTAKLQEPMKLTEQERAQVRTYEDEQKTVQTQTRTQTGSSSGSGNGSGNGSGGGSGGGKK